MLRSQPFQAINVESQQDFSALELPKRFPRIHDLGRHPAFSGSGTSIKSNSDIDGCASSTCCEGDEYVLGEHICDEALAFIRKWEKIMQTSSGPSGGLEHVTPKSLDAAECLKPPSRFWRSSWKRLTRRLTESSGSFRAY